MTATLSIGTSAIREYNGLYSLNDLHKASGNAAKHRPGYFLSNEQTKGLVAKIQDAGIPASKTVTGRGKPQGTYACRELVVAYAAWISPAFHLKVIQVFLGTQAVPPTTKTNHRLRMQVQSIAGRKGTSIVLSVRSGDAGFGVSVPLAQYRKYLFMPGDYFFMEYPHGDNLWTTNRARFVPSEERVR